MHNFNTYLKEFNNTKYVVLQILDMVVYEFQINFVMGKINTNKQFSFEY